MNDNDQYIQESLWILSRILKEKNNHMLTHYNKIAEHQREREHLKNSQLRKYIDFKTVTIILTLDLQIWRPWQVSWSYIQYPSGRYKGRVAVSLRRDCKWANSLNPFPSSSENSMGGQGPKGSQKCQGKAGVFITQSEDWYRSVAC